MAALRMCSLKRLQTKCCLISSLGGLHLPRHNQVVKPILSLESLQVAQRSYCSPAKETSDEDLKNKPIQFSTSKARHMTVGQTLGETRKSTKSSLVTFCVSLTCMAILTYIIFFLPPSKQDEEEEEFLDFIKGRVGSSEQVKGQ